MTQPDYDVFVIGAGFGGIYAMHKLREAGFTAHGVEAGSGFGGTWYWNRYPGARCDVESINYSYSFSPELDAGWSWTERFAAQPEILAYAEYVADRLGLGDSFTFNTRVASARFDESTSTWRVEASDGRSWTSRFVVTAVGALSAPLQPQLPGLESFEGEILNTATWPHEPVSLVGKRVAVIGTGSSGVQVIPELAAEAEAVTVFQRTPNFSVRVAHRKLTDEDRQTAWTNWDLRREATFRTRTGTELHGTGKALLELPQEELHEELERAWAAGYGYAFLSHFTDTSKSLEANTVLADFVRDKIRTTVRDPRTAERLLPSDHPIGAKRICLDDGYFEAFNLSHVALIDLREEQLQHATASGLQTSVGHIDADVIVFATGFDAMTGALSRIDIRGSGPSIAEHWAEGASSYLGVALHGFPNLFTVIGPGSPSTLVNVIAAIEQHVDWIVAHLEHLRNQGVNRSEVTAEAEEWWNDRVAEAALGTMHRHAASSWYLGTNVEGKQRRMLAFAGGLDAFRVISDEIAMDGYGGFTLTQAG